MKTNWQGGHLSSSTDIARVQLMIWDLLKMLVTAVLCGLAVSIAAAGLTLLLSGNAEARLFQKESATSALTTAAEKVEMQSGDPSPAPGVLLLGEGCESITLNAIERDWQVRIDDKQINVRVMQAFRLPAEAVEVATFRVQLIRGARMVRLAAQSPTKDWAARVISADQYDRLTPTEYLKLSRDQILASASPRGTVVTSPFIGLKADDLITIEYSYVMDAQSVAGFLSLVLPLEAECENGVDGSPAAGTDGLPALPAKPATRGAVWVEWIGNQPTRVLGLPIEADVELSQTRIQGFSWATDEIEPGARFHLAWARPVRQ